MSSVVSKVSNDVSGQPEVLAIPRREGWPLAALVARRSAEGDLSCARARGADRIVIFIRDPERELENAPTRIAAVFGLSRAEAEVVSQLVSGANLQEIARTRGVSLVTVRNQVKSVQAKVGVPRQAELVSLVLRTLQF